VQNPSEPAAVVSFRDDYIKWIRIEVRVGEVAFVQNHLRYTNDSK